MSRAIPLLPLWAFVAGYRVNFIFLSLSLSFSPLFFHLSSSFVALFLCSYLSFFPVMISCCWCLLHYFLPSFRVVFLSSLCLFLSLFICNIISFGRFPLSYCLWPSPCVLFFLSFFLLFCFSFGVCIVIIWALSSSLYRMKLSGTGPLQWRYFALTRPSSIVTLHVCSAQSH